MNLQLQTYRKLTVLVTVSLLIFTGVYAAQEDPLPDPSPLTALLANAPARPAYPQMTANTLSYIDYRALEAAAGLTPLTDDAAYAALSDAERAAWGTALLRAHAGPRSFINIAAGRIEDMPRLLGFGFFDVDAALVYGGAPFTGTLLYSADGDFSPARTASALIQRGYSPRTVASGGAWGLGGDGMTDINNMEMGDPFGGDVGLSSRVAVLSPEVLINSFVWPIVFVAAEAHTGDAPSYAADPAYTALSDALTKHDESLIQTVILSGEAGTAQAPHEELEPLPPYDLAAIADYAAGDEQIARIMLLYADEEAARDAAVRLPEQIRAFDNGWFTTLGYDVAAPVITPVGDYTLISLMLTAPSATPQAVADGAFEPGLVFGFWVTALNSGDFFPFAVLPTRE